LAREAVRRGIVETISHGSIGRFLKEADLKPHRVRGWLTPKSDPAFETKCSDVCSVYKEATATPHQDVRTVSVDEMTGVQALERAAPDLPMRPGDVLRREFEYVRHGTQTLIAAFDVATGQVVGTVGDTRTEQDDARFLESLFATSAQTTRWHVVADNLNTHVSESLVRLVARLRRARTPKPGPNYSTACNANWPKAARALSPTPANRRFLAAPEADGFAIDPAKVKAMAWLGEEIGGDDSGQMRHCTDSPGDTTVVGVDGPDGIDCARMRSLLISYKGDRPWSKLAALEWTRRNTSFSCMG
jgi:hypothetical protein